MVRVSVCIACKDGEEFIREQIDSILVQLGPEDEIIISDDASGDGTKAIIGSYTDPRIKLFYNAFFDLVKNFEFTLKVAQGEYVFLADQDDVWMEGKVKAMLFHLQRFDMVASNAQVVDRHKNKLFLFYGMSAAALNGENVWMKVLRSRTAGCCMAFKRKVLERALPFPKNTYMHDRWLWAVSCFFYKALVLDEPYILYRRHGKNHTIKDGWDPVLIRKGKRNWFNMFHNKYVILSNLFLNRLKHP